MAKASSTKESTKGSKASKTPAKAASAKKVAAKSASSKSKSLTVAKKKSKAVSQKVTQRAGRTEDQLSLGEASSSLGYKVPSPEDRERMIQTAAYHIAEKDGFQHGREHDYWHQAVREVDERLTQSSRGDLH